MGIQVFCKIAITYYFAYINKLVCNIVSHKFESVLKYIKLFIEGWFQPTISINSRGNCFNVIYTNSLHFICILILLS